MANNNSQLSDSDYSINANQLSEDTANWNNAVNSTNIGSINVTSVFAPLIQNGVGSGYFSSLDSALKKSDRLALNISNLIATTASEQTSADTSAAQASSNIRTAASAARSSGGSSGGGSSSGGSTNYSTSTASYDVSNTGSDLEVKTDAEDSKKEVQLTDEEEIKMLEELQSILDNELFAMLFETDDASKLKEKLLNSPNISADLKEKISSMDQNEIQTKIKDMCIEGKTVSNFSKIIITIYDNDLKKNFENATIFDSSDSIAEVYKFLAKAENPQESLSALYSGESIIDKVDDNVVNFTRNFVDTLATAANVDYKDILTNEEYKATLAEEIKDLSNTYSLIDSLKSKDEKYANSLYQNIIIKSDEQSQKG